MLVGAQPDAKMVGGAGQKMPTPPGRLTGALGSGRGLGERERRQGVSEDCPIRGADGRGAGAWRGGWGDCGSDEYRSQAQRANRPLSEPLPCSGPGLLLSPTFSSRFPCWTHSPLAAPLSLSTQPRASLNASRISTLQGRTRPENYSSEHHHNSLGPALCAAPRVFLLQLLPLPAPYSTSAPPPLLISRTPSLARHRHALPTILARSIMSALPCSG